MEARLAKLETAVEYIQRDVSEVRTDMKDVRDRIGRLETNVSHLPTKTFTVSTTLLALTVLGAITAFQEKIETVLGLGAP